MAETSVTEHIRLARAIDIARMSLCISDMQDELRSQPRKWGVQDHDPAYWALILSEEVGEAAKAALEASLPDRHNDGDTQHGYYHELIQVAAVAIAAAENYRRGAP